VTTKLRPVPVADEDSGSDSDSDAEPDALWPLGDEVATALLGLLEVELRGHGLRWRVIARDCLEVGRTDAPWPGVRLGLGPLRGRMLDRPKADWPELVELYVSELRQAGPDAAAPGEHWERLRAPLRTRILADGFADAAQSEAAQSEAAQSQATRPDAAQPGASPSGILRRPIADGLVEAVVIDGGSAGGELVSAGDVLDWGVADRLVFEAARENVRARAALEAERFTIDGAGFVALFGPSHYAASHVLWLGEHLGAMPGWDEANGALVVLPHRHLITVHPIESAAVVAAAGTLLRFAARQFETCPGPISDQLYWWHGGVLNRLPSDSVGETLQLFPSGRFTALLDRLRAGG
jgi:hypothetical protein